MPLETNNPPLQVGHSSFTPYMSPPPIERIYEAPSARELKLEAVLKKILKCRQLAHAKALVKEALAAK
jgi:hypothetical protein